MERGADNSGVGVQLVGIGDLSSPCDAASRREEGASTVGTTRGDVIRRKAVRERTSGRRSRMNLEASGAVSNA